MLLNWDAGEVSWESLGKQGDQTNLKGNQLWIFTGKTDIKAEDSILWPPDVNSWLVGKDPDAGKIWTQKEKRATEDEIVGWHHQFTGHELGQTLGDGEGQRSQVCYSPWGLEKLDATWWLNNMSQYVSVFWILLLRLIRKWVLFNWLKEKSVLKSK